MATKAYSGIADLPELVRRAVDVARDVCFDFSCRPEQGRLLRLLAAGQLGGAIGETGTGCGVGLSWMLSRLDSKTRIFSVEADPDRALACERLFADCPNVVIQCADWTALLDHAPFDLLVLDGGGAGKDEDDPVDVSEALSAGGIVVIDDFTPMTAWPPIYRGEPDQVRLHWLQHPALLAIEVRLAPDLASIVGTRIH